MFKNNPRIATALIGYCAIVVALLAVLPWIDWARHGSAWVLNLAGLPALPGVLLIAGKPRGTRRGGLRA